MKRILWCVLVIVLAMGCLPAKGFAKDCEFEFYYQKIDRVEQVNNPEPKGWWEKAKAVVKSGLNTVARVWEKEVTRNFLPGEGEKTWYSEKDHNLAYKVSRVKVRNEAHLLELMGAAGDESKLTEGQKALLEVYRHSKSQALKDRLPYSFRSDVKVLLTDTTGFDDEKKYPNIEKDFWPYSSGFAISMNSNHFNYPGGYDTAKSTFIHEFSHSMDHGISEFIKPYGADGSHYTNELTKSRASFVEGWAEFNQMLDSPQDASMRKRLLKVVRVEKEDGKYDDIPIDSPKLSGEDLTHVEGLDALVLYRLSQECQNGREKVFKTFVDTNYPWRSLKTYLKGFVKNNPGDAKKAAAILDEVMVGKLSDAQMKEFLGDSAGVQGYLNARLAAKFPQFAPASSATPIFDFIKILGPVSVIASGTNPFENH
ncbi:MAG: hypothetical protein WA705_30675 [Candidatus Ozemobacteraceae bacterium]